MNPGGCAPVRTENSVDVIAAGNRPPLTWRNPCTTRITPPAPRPQTARRGDPDAPGLVVTLSTTPQAAGGPNANLAGVFQLNSVSGHNGLTRVINDWEVGVPGFFGTNTRATLTAFLVSGTAPGMVTGHERPISNVIHERFTIGG